ncbi:MAG: PEP-utilizing enzyme [Candidatus Micrarchaeota archaeon]
MSNDKWFVMEEIPHSHFLMTAEPQIWFAETEEKFKVPGAGVDKVITKHENGADDLIYLREKFAIGSQVIFNKIMKDVSWAFGVCKLIETSAIELMKLSETIRSTDVSQLSDKELALLYEKWTAIRGEAHGSGMPWNVMEYEDQKLSKYLVEYLEKQIKLNKLDEKFSTGEVFSILSTPARKTFAKKEEEEMFALVIKKKQGENVDVMLKKHLEKYCWLPYMYEGPAWKIEYFEQVLNGLQKLPLEELKQKHAELRNYEKNLSARQKELMKMLNVDAKYARLLQLAQEIMYGKALRKDAIYHSFWCVENLFKECAKRLGLSLAQFRILLPWEVKPAFESKACNLSELNARLSFSVFYYDKYDKTTPVVLTGGKAREFYKNLNLPKHNLEINELKGECACPGKAEGIVKVINHSSEMKKMQRGDVLISTATTPDIVPAMKLASAIVTDMGGMTCHAAIVSRELGKPCVIGTKIATKWLHDGDKVIVDATKGIVRRV